MGFPFKLVNFAVRNVRTGPNQLVEPSLLDETRTLYESDKNKKEWSFRASWYEQLNWLVLCATQLKAFCFYCRFAANNLSTFSTKTGNAFTTDGFSNQKKTKERSCSQKRSHGHKKACLEYSSLKQTAVNIQLDIQAQSDQRLCRKSFITHLSSSRYSLRQQLSIRGYEESGGNLQQLLKLGEEDNGDLDQ